MKTKLTPSKKREAERLLQRLEKAKSIPTKDDKDLIKSHVKRKFARSLYPF